MFAQLATERRRTAQLVDDLKRAKEENFLAVRPLAAGFRCYCRALPACRTARALALRHVSRAVR
jgi:hypothetical protein